MDYITYQTKQDLMSAMVLAKSQPHDPKLPPWKLYILPKQGNTSHSASLSDKEEYALIFMWAHGIMDGASIWLSILPALSDTPMEHPVPAERQMTRKERRKRLFKALFDMPRSLRDAKSNRELHPMWNAAQHPESDTGFGFFEYPEVFDLEEDPDFGIATNTSTRSTDHLHQSAGVRLRSA